MKRFIAFYVILFAATVLIASCGGSQKMQAVAIQPKLVTVEDARKATASQDMQFVDVRTVEEFAGGHAAGTQNLPVESISETLGSLDKTKPVYLICRSGRRSANAAKILSDAGFSEVYDVKGGTVAWTEAGLPLDDPK